MREYASPEKVTEFGVTFAPTLPSISNRISETIKSKGLAYKEAAKRIGIPRQSLDLYSRGELHPTVEIALKLSLLLDTPVEELFSLEKGAWYTTAKDKNGYTIYYDHMRQELISGDAMKGVKKTVRYDKDLNENMSAASFERMVKEQEKIRVQEVIAKEGRSAHTRDTLARHKEAVREELERQYPTRYEMMYHALPPIK